MPYKTLLSIKDRDFSDKKVLVIGAGWMAEQYCQALAQMGIRNVCVVSRSEKSVRICCKKFGFQPFHGGYEKCLPELGTFGLVIVATPVHELKPAAMRAVECGNKNILVEKPASLYSSELFEWAKQSDVLNARIRIAYNRLAYPNLWKLKELVQSEGGVTSCRYTFTELVHTINFNNNEPDVYQRWGISNSLHVISMAHELIGMPEEIRTFCFGELEWHPSGSCFVGGGYTHKNIPFSYHADWQSAGRWGIEVMTPQNAYRLIPLEQLYQCRKGSFNWELVETTSAFPELKQGIAEQTAIMLCPEMEQVIPLVTIAQAAEYTKLAEQIFGYTSSKIQPS
ncbi:MAG: Gfo/Idh/MocA family oxidoreductase [Alphaproteobacteria bacterium]|nr:Gfo/Idh/MocA family oxidoreductase [Alphaproteobacteria bacterium]